jgi:hypothetical protein
MHIVLQCDSREGITLTVREDTAVRPVAERQITPSDQVKVAALLDRLCTSDTVEKLARKEQGRLREKLVEAAKKGAEDAERRSLLLAQLVEVPRAS